MIAQILCKVGVQKRVVALLFPNAVKPLITAASVCLLSQDSLGVLRLILVQKSISIARMITTCVVNVNVMLQVINGVL